MERLLKRFLEHHRIRSCRTSIKCCNGTCSIPSQTVKRRWHTHPWDVPKNGEQSRMKCEASQVTGFKGPNRLWPCVTMFHQNLSQVAVVAGGRRSKWTLRHGNANVFFGSYQLCNTMYASFLPCGLDQSVHQKNGWPAFHDPNASKRHFPVRGNSSKSKPSIQLAAQKVFELQKLDKSRSETKKDWFVVSLCFSCIP